MQSENTRPSQNNFLEPIQVRLSPNVRHFRQDYLDQLKGHGRRSKFTVPFSAMDARYEVTYFWLSSCLC